MHLSKIQQMFAALTFLAIFDAFYLDYLAVTFDYVYFDKVDRGWPFKIVVYCLSIFPLIFARQNWTACTLGVNLIYAISFLPSLLVIQYMSSKGSFYIFLFSLVLSLNMMLLFGADRLLLRRTSTVTNDFSSPVIYAKVFQIMKILAVACICILVFYFRNTMELVGLKEVYELRGTSDTVQRPNIVGYLNLFLTYSCVPFLIGYGIIYKHKFSLILGLASALVVYLSFGSKIALALPITVFFVHKFFLTSKNPLLVLLAMLSLGSLCLWQIDLRETPFEILKSIFAWRTVANSGWMLEKYDEFFAIHGYSYWTHIGIVGRFMEGEVTDKLQLGQLIGEHYFNDIKANFNAGFWASDGLAAGGILGIFVPTFVLSFFIIILNALTRNIDYRLVSLWFLGLWMVIMNAPLTVGLIGGGGLLNLLWVSILAGTSKFEIRKI